MQTQLPFRIWIIFSQFWGQHNSSDGLYQITWIEDQIRLFMMSFNTVCGAQDEFLGSLIITLWTKSKAYFNIRLYFIFFSL